MWILLSRYGDVYVWSLETMSNSWHWRCCNWITGTFKFLLFSLQLLGSRSLIVFCREICVDALGTDLSLKHIPLLEPRKWLMYHQILLKNMFCLWWDQFPKVKSILILLLIYYGISPKQFLKPWVWWGNIQIIIWDREELELTRSSKRWSLTPSLIFLELVIWDRSMFFIPEIFWV